MENQKMRYSDEELEEFRVLIQSKIDKAEEDLHILREQFTNNMDNGTEDTAPSFKSFEEGSETMSKEANAQLAARQEKFLRDLRAALTRISNNHIFISSDHHRLLDSHKNTRGKSFLEVWITTFLPY